MASGRFVVISISKTVESAWPETPSTAMPASVSASASRWLSTGTSTKSRIHCGDNFIAGMIPVRRDRPAQAAAIFLAISRNPESARYQQLGQRPHISKEAHAPLSVESHSGELRYKKPTQTSALLLSICAVELSVQMFLRSPSFELTVERCPSTLRRSI